MLFSIRSRSFRVFAFVVFCVLLVTSAVILVSIINKRPNNTITNSNTITAPVVPQRKTDNTVNTKNSLSLVDAEYSQLLSLPLSTQIDIAYGQQALQYRQQCYPFLFPRPTNTLFITSVPNLGAGLGHQFGEWLYGPALALMHNITYLHTGFIGNSMRWQKWLGFGLGEDEESHIHNAFQVVRTIIIEEKDVNHQRAPMTADQWAHMMKEQHIANTSVEIMRLKDTNTQPDQVPSTAVVLRLNRIHVPWPHARYSCQPQLNLLLRQKYCAARIDNPVNAQLYAKDREAGKIIVAFHLRCGDSCYSEYRATSFPSVIHTIRLMYDTIKNNQLGEAAFHLFSQPPNNNTAEAHFQPLLTAPELTGISITPHFHTHAHVTLHHLAISDVLIGAQSSFSWIASLLHFTVSMGPLNTQCRWPVKGYDKNSGNFDVQSFILEFNSSRHLTPRYDTMEDCRKLQIWNTQLRSDEAGGY